VQTPNDESQTVPFPQQYSSAQIPNIFPELGVEVDGPDPGPDPPVVFGGGKLNSS